VSQSSPSVRGASGRFTGVSGVLPVEPRIPEPFSPRVPAPAITAGVHGVAARPPQLPPTISASSW
jgi:hypothetical protein